MFVLISFIILPLISESLILTSGSNLPLIVTLSLAGWDKQKTGIVFYENSFELNRRCNYSFH
jgi:hypothetical protein